MFESAEELDRCAGVQLATLIEDNHRVYATKSEYGLKVIIGRATAGEVNVFMATINRIADILKTDGDDSTVEVRRSKALGILGQPGRALQLLLDHRTDEGHQPEPAADVNRLRLGTGPAST